MAGTQTIIKELRMHAPFTAFGTVTGVVIMAIVVHTEMSRDVSAALFWTFHPIHVLLSALVTAGMYRLHGNKGLWRTLLIGYFGSLGIATLSDSVIPYAGEILLGSATPITLANFSIGPNAILPTGGFARAFSPVSVRDYLKRSSICYVTPEGFSQLQGPAATLAEYEGFPAHAMAVRRRSQ